MAVDRLCAVVGFGKVLVVAAAQKPNVLGPTVAAESKGMAVVELQPIPCRASATLFVHVAAAALVTSVDRSPDRGRDVP